MSNLPGLLRLPREIRNRIYQLIVASDQSNDLPRTVEQTNNYTLTASSLGLLGTCQLLRGEFLDFFVDHRRHTFQDPFTFANTYLATVGNTHRIQSLRHIELTWPISKQSCSGCINSAWAPHFYADIPRHTTVTSSMRNLAVVFKTYPELAEKIETIILKFPVSEHVSHDLDYHNSDVFERVLTFLETIDAQQQKAGRPRRYFMIQAEAAGAGHDARFAEVLIWAVTKDVWDQLPDGEVIRDVTCLQCMNSDQIGSRGSWFHIKQWVHPEVCKAYTDPVLIFNGWAQYKPRYPGKNWKFNSHGRDSLASCAWFRVAQRHKSKTLKGK